jgi:hypothetical protein
MGMCSKLLAGLLVLTGATLSAQAGAVSMVRAPQAVLQASGSDLLQTVRWEQRCHREMVRSRDRYGRRIEVPRRVCERVWIGPPRY